MGAAAKGVESLSSSNVVVGMACSAVVGASGNSSASGESMKLIKTIRREMEPATTILRHIGIIYVYQFLPPPLNKCSMAMKVSSLIQVSARHPSEANYISWAAASW